MDALGVKLQEDEQVLFERSAAVLTSHRVLVLKGDPGPASTWDEASIKDVLTIQKMSGGQESRIQPGIKLAAVGGVVAAAEALAETFGDPPGIFGGVFLIGLIVFMFGMYFILSSVLRVKPHTSVFFVIPGRKDIRVSFPGQDDSNAAQLLRAFDKAKREII